MASAEFSIIQHYFQHLSPQREDVLLGIGDDCALLQAPEGYVIAVSTDTLVSGVHFFPDVDPYTLGYKSLAVNLSDLAAMGATPAWFSLAITMPEVDTDWLHPFSQGLSDLAAKHNIALVGGDTTSGPLSITIQVQGFVEQQQALKRNSAKVGDNIYVTGTLGDAGAALELKLKGVTEPNSDTAFLTQRLERPAPRVEIGQQLAGSANAAIDISDGLTADLSHILQLSNVGAMIEVESLPLSRELLAITTQQHAEQLALFSGDDYELCFTVSEQHEGRIKVLLDERCTKVGVITQQPGLRYHRNGQPTDITGKGYEHFSN